MATSDKYDRQLRLWGANGQKALMTSNILLINANSVGTETLKNLVLPGVGRFTVLDDCTVNAEDLGSNFFSTMDSIGKQRAEVATTLLNEMNDDVKGIALVANAANMFQTTPELFAQFSLIIAANVPESLLLPLSSFCWDKRIPLMVVMSLGLLGSVRLQVRDHNILETKLEADQFDLRLSNPFPTLKSFCDNIDLEKLDAMAHAHVPYIVILQKAIAIWKDQHEGKLPANFTEKSDFKALIKSMAADGGKRYNDELNFIEAVNESYRAFTSKRLSFETEEYLQNQRTTQLTPASSDFACLMRALQIFVDRCGSRDTPGGGALENGQLPLPGQIPDMTSTTENFVQIQRIYHEKAQQDLADFKRILCVVLDDAGLSRSHINDETLELFCKNCATAVSLTTSALHQELSHDAEKCVHTGETIRDVLENELFEDPQQTPILWYLTLRAATQVYERNARWPGDCAALSRGSGDATIASHEESSLMQRDAVAVLDEMRVLCIRYGLPDVATLCKVGHMPTAKEPDGSGEMDATNEDDSKLWLWPHAVEIVRFGGCQMHTISSIIGGVASQEAVKLLTGQYKPLENTYVYNGIAGCGAAYRL